jgi:hypothetical protein
MDNSMAVAYINHKGGTHSPHLVQLALDLWNWCIQRDIFVVHTMFQARFHGNLGILDPSFIRPFLRHCQTDLFATRLTHQLPTYISWRSDPKALHSDAFSLN